MNTATAKQNLPRTAFLIPNFVEGDPIEIEASLQEHVLETPVVHITQRSGSMSFQHTITADQCHIMAAALVKAAAEATAIYAAKNVLELLVETAGAQ